MRGDDDATRQAQRDALEARLANNASGRFAENWYRGVDDISKNIGLQKIIDDSDREIQRNVDTLVRNQEVSQRARKSLPRLARSSATWSTL